MCEIEETFTVSGNSEKMRYSVSLCRILSIVWGGTPKPGFN